MNNDKVNLKSRVQKQQKKKIRKIRFYHSFLTIVLLVCVFQISVSALLNLAKIVIYQAKIISAKELKQSAEERNANLKNEIENFNSMYKVESIARNNLKMAAKDEVLVIINQTSQENNEAEKMQNNKFVMFLEDFASKFGVDTTGDKNND
jgi:cell division protein FtsB